MATLKFNSLTTHSYSWQDYYICAPREMARQTEQPPQVCRGAWVKLPPSHLLLKIKDPNAVDLANSKVNASALPVTTYATMAANLGRILHMMNLQHDGLPSSTLRSANHMANDTKTSAQHGISSLARGCRNVYRS